MARRARVLVCLAAAARRVVDLEIAGRAKDAWHWTRSSLPSGIPAR